MPSFQVLVLGFADGFLSPFLDSLPQLFLKCFPYAFAFGLSLPIRFLSSAPLSVLATQPSVLPFLLFSVPPHSCFPDARLRSRFLGLLFLSSLISHAFLPDSCTRLSVCFLSSLPDSLPQLFLRCFPSAFAFGPSPFNLLSFVRFSSGSYYSASVSSFPLSSRLRLTVASSVRPSALASLAFPVLPDLISHVFFPGSSYSASCMFPFALP